jgi:hypothetical protein
MTHLFELYRNSAFPIAYRLVRRGNAEPILQGRFVFSDAPGNVYKRWQDLETVDEPEGESAGEQADDLRSVCDELADQEQADD